MKTDADTFVQALADRTRLRTLILLRREPPLCVCELTTALDVSQPKMSRHLAALRALNIVEDARIANRVFYRLHPALHGWARGVLDHLAAGIAGSPAFTVVERRLAAFPNRPVERPSFESADGRPRRRQASHGA